MVRPRVAIWVLVALVAGAVALAPLHGGVKTADAAAIAFETPTIVDPIHTNGEPDIAIDPQGRVFNSGPTGTGTQRSTWFGSVDGGHTFRVMSQKTVPSPIVGIPAPGPGGGDTDIAFDRSGKQYFADLWALACQRVAVTGPINSGATDEENFLGCAGSSPGSAPVARGLRPVPDQPQPVRLPHGGRADTPRLPRLEQPCRPWAERR